MVYKLDAISAKATELNKKKLIQRLSELKKNLSDYHRDNYGICRASTEKKMADLYSKIADSYDKPSNAELESLAVIEERFEKAKEV